MARRGEEGVVGKGPRREEEGENTKLRRTEGKIARQGKETGPKRRVGAEEGDISMATVREGEEGTKGMDGRGLSLGGEEATHLVVLEGAGTSGHRTVRGEDTVDGGEAEMELLSEEQDGPVQE
jgi:hypothetical protein